MQLFSADATMFLNIYFLKFLPPKTWKNLPQKLLIIGPELFLYSTGPDAKMAQKQKSRTTKSSLLQDWVFRLGLQTYKNSTHIVEQFCLPDNTTYNIMRN